VLSATTTALEPTASNHIEESPVSVIQSPAQVIGGVDTHKHVHVAAALNGIGQVLGVESFPANPAGYRQLLDWLTSHGQVIRVGVEGTGTYGAGLTRLLLGDGVEVVEIDRPNRQRRRREGKSDPIDAVAAARAALAGDGATPKNRSGSVEAIRALRVVRRGARADRTRAINQLRCLIDTAPDELREPLRHLPIRQLIDTCSRLRPAGPVDAVIGTKIALRELAGRIRSLEAEITRLDAELEPLVAATSPELVALFAVGTDTAGALLVAVGDNPDRLRNEAAFARLCGVAPLEASTGLYARHRLNRSGDRQANSALWRITLIRMRHDEATKAYVERRLAEGKSKPEIMRCLKRYIAREVFRAALATYAPNTRQPADQRLPGLA
jgi:transposase